jgi:predicted Zn-dependent peptidase
MQDQQFPVLLKGSRYADRLPIGKTEVIQGFKHDRLKQFYADWYRPDLMAVIAVGDFDKAAMQAMIQKHFSGIPRAAKPRPRPAYDVPKQPGTMYSVATDPEAPMTRSASTARWHSAIRRRLAHIARRSSSACSDRCCRRGWMSSRRSRTRRS